MKYKKSAKKILSALAIGILALTGGAFAVQNSDNQINPEASYQVLKSVQNNPVEFVNLEKLDIPSDFDYFVELNREFVKEIPDDDYGINEDAISSALTKGDFESWRNELNAIEESPYGNMMSQEDFEILKELRKN